MRKTVGRGMLMLALFMVLGTNLFAADAKPTELIVAFYVFGEIPKDMKLVESEISKITLSKINATVKLLPIPLGSWDQQVNLMLASGEKLDALTLRSSLFSGMVAKGQVIALDDLLNKHGKGIKEAIGSDYLQAGTVNGKVYGVTSIRDLAIGLGLLIRTDYVEKYGIDAKGYKSLDDIEKILKKLKDAEPGLYPLSPSAAILTYVDLMVENDTLGDGFGQLLNGGEKLEVVNWFATPQYAALLDRVRRWYTSGYSMKDSATNQESVQSLIKSGRGVSWISRVKPGIATAQSNSTGRPLTLINMFAPYSTTSVVQTLQWGIPLNAKDPAKSMQFLNLMYTDTALVNLLDWGIEGKHYVKNADGRIAYPGGINATNSGYNLNMGWVFGNQYLSLVWESDPKDLWDIYKDFNSSAKTSKAMGFTFNSSAVKTEIASLSSVASTYKVGLETGTLDPKVSLPEFLEKLKAAGIEKVIAEKQRQIDAWYASNH